MKNTTRYAITVICEDRVGLVSRFTGAITRLGGNIEVLDQNVRLGYFVITLMATFETGVTAQDVRVGLEKIDDAGTPAIGVINQKTTATRLIPVPGKKPGQWVHWGGALRSRSHHAHTGLRHIRRICSMRGPHTCTCSFL